MAMEEMFAGESKNIEYNQDVPANSEKYLKTIIAFANGNGGQLVFGIEDGTCKIIGIPQDTVFATADRITNAIVDSVQPMADFEIKYQTIEGKTIIIVQVFSWDAKTFFFQGKRHDGWYLHPYFRNNPKS